MATIVDILPDKYKNKKMCLAMCQCGVVYKSRLDHIKRVKTASCGCVLKAKNIEANLKRRNPLGHNGKMNLLRRYKEDAKTRDIVFNLSNDDFFALTKQNCFYCGPKPLQECFELKSKTISGRNHTKYIYNGIDRVDSSKPYELGNVVSCCRFCNHAKGAKSVDEFTNWQYRLVSFLTGEFQCLHR
jgi:5-methylcytosine-specific restriction endonuclease McrA